MHSFQSLLNSVLAEEPKGEVIFCFISCQKGKEKKKQELSFLKCGPYNVFGLRIFHSAKLVLYVVVKHFWKDMA